VAQARLEWEEQAQHMLGEQIDDEALDVVREHAARRLAELETEIDSINEQLRLATDGHFILPAIDIPAAQIDEKLARQASLVSSAWSWAEATRALIARKTYGDPV
jgi:hypothetical protein